jgi:hypothetical protein
VNIKESPCSIGVGLQAMVCDKTASQDVLKQVSPAPIVSAIQKQVHLTSPKANLKRVISELKSKRSQSTERKQGADLQNEVERIL